MRSHWWDPFDRNKLKGDVPIFGQQTFFNFTGDERHESRRATPADAQRRQHGAARLAGIFRQGRAVLRSSQTFRFSFDLFHGDTSFRPVDWRIRVTPAVNVNYLAVRGAGHRQR